MSFLRLVLRPLLVAACMAPATFAAAAIAAVATEATAQSTVRTETIQVPAGTLQDDPAEAEPIEGGSGEGDQIDDRTGGESPAAGDVPAGTPEEAASGEDTPAAGLPADVVPAQYDLSILPPPVARMRDHIIRAARTGDIEQLRPVLEANELPPIFSFGGEFDPIAYWKSASGDPDGREILAIMIEILEAGFAHLDEGTPQEMYVWPYFHAVPFDALTPEQEVELYKIITPQDRKGMEDYGAYTFFRLGIGPDGTWHFFVAGD